MAATSLLPAWALHTAFYQQPLPSSAGHEPACHKRSLRGFKLSSWEAERRRRRGGRRRPQTMAGMTRAALHFYKHLPVTQKRKREFYTTPAAYYDLNRILLADKQTL